MAIGLVASAGLLLASVVPAFGATGGLLFTVELTGAAEVTGGDPDGSGTATVTVNPGTGEVCWTILDTTQESLWILCTGTDAEGYTGNAGGAFAMRRSTTHD